MLDGLQKYKQNNHFFLDTDNNNLKEVCNAPTEKSGVYIVYALEHGKVRLIYIGRSGKLKADGTMFIRKAGLGGLKDRIVNGHHFGKVPRRISWLNQMKKENIDALDVYWYATHNDEYCDCPTVVEHNLLQDHFDIHGELPRWNKKL